jgi:hypothetical protein
MRRPIALAWLLLVLPSALVAAESPAGRSVVLIRAAADQGPALVASGFTLTAEIDGGFLALLAGEDLARLTAAGHPHVVVAADDPATDILVRYAPDGTADVEPLTPECEILHREPGLAIMRLPADERRVLPPLCGVQRVFRHPLRYPAAPWTGPAAKDLIAADPAIAAMVAEVADAWLLEHVQILEDFGTRHSQSAQGAAASLWLRDQFLAYGYTDVSLHSYNSWNDNVVCVKPGAVAPDTYVVIGGHYDSISFGADPEDAPGADDNATGTVCVLAAARAMAPWTFEHSVVFIAFSGEEQGLYGSTAWATAAADSGLDIAGVVVLDMLGYVKPGTTAEIDIIFNAASEPLRAVVDEAVALYVPDHLAVDGQLPPGAGSDHVSFWNAGYRAVMFFEDSVNYSPYLHTANDLIGPSVNDIPYLNRNVRTAIATTAMLARPWPAPSPAEDLPPAAVYLQAQPNPFNPLTTVRYAVPRPGHLELDIHCLQGRRVARPLAGAVAAGPGSVVWNAADLPSGVYLARLRLDGEVLRAVKLTLVR